MPLSHVDDQGRARMVDISGKKPLARTAIASGFIAMKPETVVHIRENTIAKGDVLSVAKVAGIFAAKNTGGLIPLCHSLKLDHLDIQFEIEITGVRAISKAVCVEKTGVEMEALTAVAVALLTIYDMCKAVDKAMRIGDIFLVEKKKE
jgi:cyclic pyranopterin phosphate synthase